MDKLFRIELVRSAFAKNGWSLEKTKYQFIFDKYCELIDLLNDQEFEIFILLTEQFTHRPFEFYPTMIEECLEKIDFEKYNKHTDVYVVPLSEPKDQKKALKSGDALAHPFCYQYLPMFLGREKNIELVPKANSLIPKQRSRNPGFFIFIDDFVGTGDTGNKAIGNFKGMVEKKGDSVIIISLTAMQAGISILSPLVDEFVCALILKKGVTDSTSIKNKREAFSVIDRIEKRLNNVGEMRYGYKKSEGLVSMTRTPDNTFPMFWWDKCADGKPWPAPFYR